MEKERIMAEIKIARDLRLAVWSYGFYLYRYTL